MRTEQIAPPSPPASSDVLAGTPYRTIRRLGRGGMGEVLEAEHVVLGKRVVVKLLRSELTGDAALVERLRIEAQAMAKLQHPHIASVHDLGTTPGGRPYLVMEYLSGATVAEELRARGPLPLREAIRIVLEVLDALGAAHAAGLVHRDVKAPNVFLCDADRTGRRHVKLLDFGVVKVSPARLPRSFPTEEGQFLGSPASASPEQARGESVDARADLYAAGLLLYTLVAGRGPFASVHVPQSMLIAQVISVPRPLSTAAPYPVPHVLDVIVAKALAKAPADRYATAAQMSAALSRVLAKLPPEPPAPPARSVARGPRGAHGTILLADETGPEAETAELPPGETVTLAARGVVPVPSSRAGAASRTRRAFAIAAVALATGALFFVLLRVVWRMLRGG